MTASTSTPIRRQREVRPFAQEKRMKLSVSFVRRNANEGEIDKEEFACEQNNSENIFRLSSRRAEEADSELREMWNLKRASPIVSGTETDDRLGRERSHMIGTSSSNLLSLMGII
jgi:hypothetical protein